MRITLAVIIFIFNISFAYGYKTEVAKNGETVILQTKDLIGAFVLSNQTPTFQQATYQWALYKKDAQSLSFIKIDSGNGVTGDIPKKFLFFEYVLLNPIKFGPFSIYWSGKGKRSGWVYFDFFENNSDLKYCIYSYNLLNETQFMPYGCHYKNVY
ncbi:hypothetical protein [Aliamphritea ceti]|uniref:hypothetical protein n=1 Tax=Aliamphritea ceti TaxID=1524258 RepID=UPI0021C2CE8A|nr:hypothetical protein [Aliamphritea ceti]